MQVQPKRAVILHGCPGKDEYFNPDHPSSSNSHWIPWLQNQLRIRGYDAQTPEMYNAYRPDYAIWQAEFERNIVSEPMTLVGHSCGGGFLVRWLSEHRDVRVETLVLVAPWFDPDRTDTTDFFEFTVDDSLPSRVDNFHLFLSRTDFPDVQASVEEVLRHFPTITVHEYQDSGHFLAEDLGGEAFPNLLEVFTKDAGH